MKQRTHDTVTTAISFVALLLSSVAIYLSWSQYQADYDKSVLVPPGRLPLTKIHEGESSFDLEIINTSKSNLQYFLRVSSNMGCVNGENGRSAFLPCGYESQVVSLSKSDAGRNAYKHAMRLNSQHGAVNAHPFAYISPAEYFLNVEVIDASNGRILYKSECFYAYHAEAKVFGIDQPYIDTSGQSAERQKQCRA